MCVCGQAHVLFGVSVHQCVCVGVCHQCVFACISSVMLGMMLPTWFLSMWISNTATASMMIPIANSVVSQMGCVQKGMSALWLAQVKVHQAYGQHK